MKNRIVKSTFLEKIGIVCFRILSVFLRTRWMRRKNWAKFTYFGNFFIILMDSVVWRYIFASTEIVFGDVFRMVQRLPARLFLTTFLEGSRGYWRMFLGRFLYCLWNTMSVFMVTFLSFLGIIIVWFAGGRMRRLKSTKSIISW